MLSLLIRFLNRFRPRDGWVPFFLTIGALFCPPAALIETNDDVDVWALLVLTTLAAIVGLRLARSRLSARGAMILAGLCGGILTVVLIGQLLPPPSLLWTEIKVAADWMELLGRGVIDQPLPFTSAAQFSWKQLNSLGIRLWWWGQTVASGGTARDPIPFLLLAPFLAWACGCFASWQIYRHRSALIGLLPSGVAVATLSFFGGGLTTFYLLVYLFCTLWLVAACHLWSRHDHWQRAGIDYPGELGVELIFALSPALVLLLLLAAFFPVIHPRQVRDRFWELLDGPWSAVERVSEQLFGPIQRGGYAGGGPGGSLPRSHLLGEGPELDETVVMYVTTSDPPPPLSDPAEPENSESDLPPRYWRSTTYDTYTGQGWDNNPLQQRASPANQPLDPNLPPGFELVQQFDLVISSGEIYAVNAPLLLDHAVQSWWRAPQDLAQLTGSADRYTVISRPPEPNIADLRNASPFVPPDIAGRYLALPETVPRRVEDLAQQVIGDAEIRYDQARAIETYLRAYTYTLDLPDPPTDRDLVDYFLFEQQEGYCDYYASAMVIMARSVGIPARLASGFIQGTYNRDERRWMVAQKDGHTWVEIYFDGIGWVEFEPTAGVPALDRSGSGGSSRPSVPPLPARMVRWWQPVPWALLALGGVLILAVVIVVWIWRPRQGRDPAATDLVFDRYTRLLHWGARVGRPFRDGQTAHEYGSSLGNALGARGQDARWFQVRQASAEAPAEIEGLTETFVRAQYSPEPITDREGRRIRDLWARLRRHLWWLWLGHR